jgi:chemotaxis protein MotB
MHVLSNKRTAAWVGVLSLALLAGCTNWRQRYEYLRVESEDQKAKLAKSDTDKARMADQIAHDQTTIEDLTRQLEAMQKNPGQAGFGNLPVSIDPLAGTITVTLEDSLLFASGKATLKSSTIRQLDDVVSVIKSRYPGKVVDVIGHTDADPIRRSKWQDNLQLSCERAMSVTRYLDKRGLSLKQVRSIGRGAADPKDSNSTAAGKAKNRRVEIVVHVKPLR